MRLLKALFVLIALVCFMPTAHADSTPVTMVFTGVNGANDGQYYVSPYNATMNGQAVTLFCIDILNEVSIGQVWSANVTNLASLNLSNTRYGNSSISPVAGDAQTRYEEAAWLTTKFASNPQDYVSLQYALWDLMNPGSEPTSYGDVQHWLDLAAANYSTVNLNNFEIVTNTGPVTLRNQVQEFIVQTPEPSTILLVFLGFVFFLLFLGRRQARSAQVS